MNFTTIIDKLSITKRLYCFISILADGLFTPMSDIWSYGVLLYEMITFGSFPFQGLSNNQVMEHVKAGHTLSIPSGIKQQLETLLKVSTPELSAMLLL